MTNENAQTLLDTTNAEPQFKWEVSNDNSIPLIIPTSKEEAAQVANATMHGIHAFSLSWQAHWNAWESTLNLWEWTRTFKPLTKLQKQIMLTPFDARTWSKVFGRGCMVQASTVLSALTSYPWCATRTQQK